MLTKKYVHKGEPNKSMAVGSGFRSDTIYIFYLCMSNSLAVIDYRCSASAKRRHTLFVFEPRVEHILQPFSKKIVAKHCYQYSTAGKHG